MSLLFQKEGILTTVQGLGKYGMQRFGVNPGGAMDRTAARLINLIVGNPDDDPVIEMHFPAGEVVFEQNCVFALGGADFDTSLNGDHVENWSCVRAEQEGVLKFRRKMIGNRCYLAVKGGFKTDEKGSGVFNSPRLKKGDRIALNPPAAKEVFVVSQRVSNSILPVYGSFPTVRIVEGGEFDSLSGADKRSLIDENFTIRNDSNRMGYRLNGRPLSSIRTSEMVSAAVSFGTIQLLPDGQLIVLMADHQTSGGYPRIANVISVDLPLLAQLGAGDKVAFKLVDIEEAERLNVQFEQDLRRLKIGCGFGRYW